MSKNVNQYLQDKVNQRKEKNAFRVFKINEGLVDFCSNDYLGFAQDKEIACQLANHASRSNSRRSSNIISCFKYPPRLIFLLIY